MKYIDSEKLIAEIKRRLVKYDTDYTSAGIELKELLSFINSLQQEQREVDLEKEIEEHAIHMSHAEFASDNEILEDMEWARAEFRHFYEFGLNARKEE